MIIKSSCICSKKMSSYTAKIQLTTQIIDSHETNNVNYWRSLKENIVIDANYKKEKSSLILITKFSKTFMICLRV